MHPESDTTAEVRRALVLPGALWLAIFSLTPLLILAGVSFLPRSSLHMFETGPLTLENYRRALEPIYLGVIESSAVFAFLTCLASVFLAFPMALYLARIPSKKWKLFALILTMMPFFTNCLVRLLGWLIVLRTDGWLAQILIATGFFPDGVLNTRFAVFLGMVYTYLPYMVLPLYSALEKFDFTLLDAAYDLGASHVTAIRRILLPHCWPGLVSGCVLVAVPVMGEFLVPKLLGGGKVATVGTLVEDQFLGRVQMNWPFGSALTILLLAMLFLSLAVSRWVQNRSCAPKS